MGERYGPRAKPSVKAAAGWKAEGGMGHGVRRAPSTEEVCSLWGGLGKVFRRELTNFEDL